MLAINQRQPCCNGCCPNPFHYHPDSSSSPVTTAARAEFHFATTSALFPNLHEFTNHESLPSLVESFSNFMNVFPRYSGTDKVDRIRERDYSHLNVSKHVCFDYIGHGLFSYSQLNSFCSSSSMIASTSSSSSGNPLFSEMEPPFFDISCKSVNLSSLVQYGGQESELEMCIRRRITAFMNLSEEDYTMVFTANQSSAFRLLAESYPFQSKSKLVSVYDYENEAVQIVREVAKRKGAKKIVSAEFSWPDLRIQYKKLMKKIQGKSKKRGSRRGLFVFPVQSRVTGSRYSYQWMNLAQESGWNVLLDASGLGSKEMETLGLSLFKPDFLFCSFYKIFGENPSGFGCLFIHKSTASLLKNSTLDSSIGIVNLIPSLRSYQFPKTEQKSASEFHHVEETDTKHRHRELSFSQTLKSDTPQEDFTTKEENFTLEIEFKGLDHADELGLITISNRARYLINWLVHALMCLQHPYKQPLVRIYGPNVMFDRGPSIAFNVFDWNGDKVDPALVQRLADRYNISLSCGVVQNMCFGDKFEEEKKRVVERDGGIGVVTAALGLWTNFEDVYRVWGFVARFLDADFVQKERWRYLALNQKTIEI